jgi:hypothetical protein
MEAPEAVRHTIKVKVLPHYIPERMRKILISFIRMGCLWTEFNLDLRLAKH